MGEETTEFEITIDIMTIIPINDSVIDQGELIIYTINSIDWRTILFNLNGNYNTTYLPEFPKKSGLHNLTIYLEDNQRRWSSFYYQWWIKPKINLENSYNNSYLNTNFLLNFTFGEIVYSIEYQWGNDISILEQNIETMTTQIYDWSNKTSINCLLKLRVRGNDNIWNNQTYEFKRDDVGINIYLNDIQNNSVINAPLAVSFSFSEEPKELAYAWDSGQNCTTFYITNPYSIALPTNISDNPHHVELYFRDDAHNWNYSQYTFYTGTGIYSLSKSNGSLIQGGSIITFELTRGPLHVGYEWLDTINNLTIINLQWMNPAQNYTLSVPFINDWSELLLFYDLGGGVIINESLMYHIDSLFPSVKIWGTEDPFKSLLFIENGTKRTINSCTVINLTVSESILLFTVKWSNTTILYDDSFLSNETLLVYFNTLITESITLNLTAVLRDYAGNIARYIFYFQLDENLPTLVSTTPITNSKVKPNTSLVFDFNETIYCIEISIFKDGSSLRNNTYSPKSISFIFHSEVAEGKYDLFMVIYDLAGNKVELCYTYTVDSSPPKIQFSYNNNTFLQSAAIIRLTFSEPIRNCSFYFWDDIGQRVFINTTPLDLPLASFGEGLHTIFVYAEDLLGNNQTYSYHYIIDDTHIGSPTLSLSSGAIYSNDIKVLRCFFDEKPSLVIVNWNNGTNVTMTILVGANLMLSMVEEAGIYYILIDLPTGNFKTHILTIYLMDEAGNWFSYEYSYFRIPSVREICPLLLITTIFFITILYMKRESIRKYFQHFSLRPTKKSDIKTENSQESSTKTIEEAGDRTSYKLGSEIKKKSKKKSPESKYNGRKTKKRKRRS